MKTRRKSFMIKKLDS